MKISVCSCTQSLVIVIGSVLVHKSYLFDWETPTSFVKIVCVGGGGGGGRWKYSWKNH